MVSPFLVFVEWKVTRVSDSSTSVLQSSPSGNFPSVIWFELYYFCNLHALANVGAYCNNILDIAISRDISYVVTAMLGDCIEKSERI